MILKTFESKKINLDVNKIVLFYGQNEGLKKEELEKIKIQIKKSVTIYEEKQILEDQNCGTGVVEMAVFLASGLNIHGAVYGHGGSAFTAIAFWGIGQIVLVGVGKYYNVITNYDIHEHIEKENVAGGVGFAGALIAIGNLLRAAAAEDFVSWADNLTGFFGILAAGFILLPLASGIRPRTRGG